MKAPKQACLVLHMPSASLPKAPGVTSHATMDRNRNEKNAQWHMSRNKWIETETNKKNAQRHINRNKWIETEVNEKNTQRHMNVAHSVLFDETSSRWKKAHLTPAILHGRLTRLRQARRITLLTVSLAWAPKGSSSGLSLVGCTLLLASA